MNQLILWGYLAYLNQHMPIQKGATSGNGGSKKSHKFVGKSVRWEMSPKNLVGPQKKWLNFNRTPADFRLLPRKRTCTKQVRAHKTYLRLWNQASQQWFNDSSYTIQTSRQWNNLSIETTPFQVAMFHGIGSRYSRDEVSRLVLDGCLISLDFLFRDATHPKILPKETSNNSTTSSQKRTSSHRK